MKYIKELCGCYSDETDDLKRYCVRHWTEMTQKRLDVLNNPKKNKVTTRLPCRYCKETFIGNGGLNAHKTKMKHWMDDDFE